MYQRLVTSLVCIALVCGICFALMVYNNRERDFEAPRFTTPTKVSIEAKMLSNLQHKYNVSRKLSYDTVSTAYVSRLKGTSYDATILSECQTWVDTFVSNVRSQTQHSTKCLPDKALMSAGKLVLVQAQDAQREDIKIFDHYTVNDGSLPKCYVASIKIHDRTPVATVLAKNVVVKQLALVTGRTTEFMESVFDNVSDLEPACALLNV